MKIEVNYGIIIPSADYILVCNYPKNNELWNYHFPQLPPTNILKSEFATGIWHVKRKYK